MIGLVSSDSTARGRAPFDQKVSWRTLLRGDPLPWLLERSDPAVRAMALRLLEDRPARDPEVREAQRRAMAAPPISTILRRQDADGGWGEDFYTPKYTSTHWEMAQLIEFGADGSDPRVRRGARRMLDVLARGLPAWLRKDHGLSCFYGTVLRYACLAGFGSDERLEPAVERLCRDSKVYEGACFINGELPCAWGYSRLLWSLAALPRRARTREVERTLRRGADWLLSHRLERGAYPTSTKPSRLWDSLNFPLFYQADVLFVLRVLGELGALDDPRARPALAWLLARQDAGGRWPGRAPYLKRMPAKIEADRWVTLHAAWVLKVAFPDGRSPR